MPHSIRNAAVLGAGVMGSGIAAHLANAGVPVLLLDMVPRELSEEDQAQGLTKEDPRFRNKLAAKGLEGIFKSKPAALYSKKAAALIEIGNFEDDWDKLGERDWIVEAVVERLDIKQSLFERVDGVRKAHSLVSSNTSGLSLEGMVEGRSESFRKHFLITHFFNPVRYMRLLEIVAGPDTEEDVVSSMATFGRQRLGKGIVYGRDTPNFVANRIGVYGMAQTIRRMVEMGYQVDEVDSVTGPALARPKSATFTTADVVGLDVLLHTFGTTRDGAPEDEGQPYDVPPFLDEMVKAGALGRKAGAGFYKLERGPKGKKTKLVLDWQEGSYRPAGRLEAESLKAVSKMADPRQRIKTVVNADDRAGAFAWPLVRDTLAYASRRLGEVAGSVIDIDRALRWGFTWDLGPFEIWDALGVAETVERMKADGVAPAAWVEAMLEAGGESFYRLTESATQEVWDSASGSYVTVPRPAEVLVLKHLKKASEAVYSNPNASLVDLGDGIACLEFHSQVQPTLNPVDEQITEALVRSVEIAEKDFRGLVIHHQGANFSAGANLMGVLQAAKGGQWETLEGLVRGFQAATTGLRASRVPVVAAPFGFTFGGGAEMALGADRMLAHAETYMGLVEAGVGLVPGGGGHLFLLERHLDPDAKPFNDNLPIVQRLFETIAMAKASSSGEEARELGFLRRGDHVEMDRDRQLWSAKRMAAALADLGYRAPLPRSFSLPGRAGISTLEMGLHNMKITHWISEHDAKVASCVARVLCGGDTTPRRPVSEQDILDLECEAFLSLCGEEKTHERIEHMLQTGKPLRN